MGRQAKDFKLVVKWSSTAEVGESGGYLTRDFKSQVWEPMLQRVAIHVYGNFEIIEFIKIMIGIGMAWMTIITLYIAHLRCTSRCKAPSDQLEKGHFKPDF